MWRNVHREGPMEGVHCRRGRSIVSEHVSEQETAGNRPPRAASPCAPEWRGASGSDSVPLPRLSEIVIARGSVFRVLPGYKAQRKFRIFLVSKSEMQQPTSLHPNWNKWLVSYNINTFLCLPHWLVRTGKPRVITTIRCPQGIPSLNQCHVYALAFVQNHSSPWLFHRWLWSVWTQNILEWYIFLFFFFFFSFLFSLQLVWVSFYTFSKTKFILSYLYSHKTLSLAAWELRRRIVGRNQTLIRRWEVTGISKPTWRRFLLWLT